MRKKKVQTISVIIPTKNRPVLLGRVLLALRKQLSKIDTVVVVDTSDVTFQWQNKAIVDSFPATFILYYVLPHASASRARNYGISHSTGEILAFLDDDSVPEPGWDRAIQKAVKVGLYCFRGQCIDASENTSLVHRFYTFYKELVTRDMKRQWSSYGTWKGYQLVDQIQAGNFFCSRTILTHITPVFDEQLFPFMAEEMDFSLRVRQLGYQILFVPEAKIKHYFLRLGYRSFVLYSAFWYGRASVLFDKRIQRTLAAMGLFGKTIANTVLQKRKMALWHLLQDGYALFCKTYAKNIVYNVTFFGICLSYLLFLRLGRVYGTMEYYWKRKKGVIL